MCTKSIYEARNNLSALVELAESGEPVILTRYNKPVAVISSYEEYENTPQKPSLIQRLQNIKNNYMDISDDFDGIPLPPKYYADPNRIIFEE